MSTIRPGGAKRVTRMAVSSSPEAFLTSPPQACRNLPPNPGAPRILTSQRILGGPLAYREHWVPTVALALHAAWLVGTHGAQEYLPQSPGPSGSGPQCLRPTTSQKVHRSPASRAQQSRLRGSSHLQKHRSRTQAPGPVLRSLKGKESPGKGPES